ncbi:MAG TPA: ice-binding family protein [Segetibacter sp.]
MKSKFLHTVATVVAVLFFPVFNFAQAPNLGTAANFVLFTSNGAVTNTGTSKVTGNVGSNSGAVTGFGNVNGTMNTSNGATLAAAADLQTAYKQLDDAIPTASHAPALGNGEALTPGIYFIAGNTTLNNPLLLDAEGNANAVFIFQIEGTFSAANKAEIVLTNNALACNVFWKIEGAVSMATSTVMKGNIIANNAAIALNGAALDGRALSTTGAITLDAITAKIPVGCGSTVLTGPAAPNLRSTVCYSLFSANGQVTNTGITYLTGDVGTNVGLTTGYSASTVRGTIHASPDGSTAAAAADLLEVYSYLNTLPGDIELLYPAQFGRGLTLTPHTYVMNGATTFNDTVFLNAEGNQNAVFVIKINGALSTGTFATVKLMNGAQAKNVFWKVEGAVNISNNANFTGTIVANNGAISLGTSSILNGRALTTNGALSSAAINATISAGCTTLPLNWLYFRGIAGKDDVRLEWGTTNEVNNGFFTIEKSSNGTKFEILTTVPASKEAGIAEVNYSYPDRAPYPVTYYRISQTDRDGQKNYYRTIQVKTSTDGLLKAMAYQRGNDLYVRTTNATAGNGVVELISIEGKRLFSQKIVLSREETNYKIKKPLQVGVYIYNIISNGAKVYTGKVLVY